MASALGYCSVTISLFVFVHADVVTCMALDKAGSGDHLITGSRDTTCAIWKLGSNVRDRMHKSSLYSAWEDFVEFYLCEWAGRRAGGGGGKMSPNVSWFKLYK